MRCLHPQTDNPRQFSSDYRIVLEDPTCDARELRIINRTRWPDALYARFCVGPGLDQALLCLASAPGPFRPSTRSTTAACPSPRVRVSDRSSAEMWTNTSLPRLSRTIKPYRKCSMKTTFSDGNVSRNRRITEPNLWHDKCPV